ncbi:pyroglutamylated RF-amide peptide receptor isoform X1 [Anguilla rostrata]|uniref:pyroglutamylated RF-amide peptide receptor isoform X1 n=1 Tax=Anguilla rostrata TaxID=7938 RepID=UPI0030D286B5
MNLTPQLLDLLLEASNFSRRQFIQEYGPPPLVYIPRLPTALQPIFGLVYVLIFILALVGNTTVLILLCRRKALQSPSTFFICSLALSDLLISIFCMPATLLQHFFTNWLAGDFLCKLIPFLQVTAIATSILTMTCIAVERFKGILYPLKLQSGYSPCHAMKMLGHMVFIIPSGSAEQLFPFLPVAVWLIALAVAGPMWYAHKVEVKYDFLYDVHYTCCQEVWPHPKQRQTYTTVLSVLVFLVPMLIMAVLYGRIMAELWGKHRVHDVMFQALPGSEIKKITRKRRHAVKMMATVVLLFAICWAPFQLVSLLSDYGMLNLNSDHEFMVFSTVQILGFSNSVCNPLVYAALNNNFKKDLVGLLRRGRGKGWCPPRQLRRKVRVGVSANEPPCLRKCAERDTNRGARQWSRVAWEAEPTTSRTFPQSHLFRVATKKTSSPLLLSVTDPLPVSTSRS